MDRTVWAGQPSAPGRALPGRRVTRPRRDERGLSRLRRGPGPPRRRRGDCPPPSRSVPAVPDSPEQPEILDALDRDRKRFLREIRTTAQLEHPGTPAVYDTGVETAPDGSPQLWLVMQLLRGSTLEALLDHADYVSTPPGASPGGDESRDPTRPFRRPLLAPARSRRSASNRGRLTDAEAERLKANVRTLLDNDRPSEAISLLEDGVDRAPGLGPGTAAAPFPGCRTVLRRGVHVFAGEYTRAASLFDAVGADYRRYLPPTDSYVLDCAYHAGHAYAEIGKPDKALAQLRFYVQNADAAADEDEADKVLGSRFVITQMLAAAGYLDEALAELRALRPLLARTFGIDSTQVRNLDKQISRLRSA